MNKCSARPGGTGSSYCARSAAVVGGERQRGDRGPGTVAVPARVDGFQAAAADTRTALGSASWAASR
jgi:hypothetical protein